MNLISQKMGISEWSYHNDYNPAARQKMTHVDLTRRFEQLNIEVELGFTRRPDRARSPAMPELRCADRLHRAQMHRVRRLHRYLPGACLTITRMARNGTADALSAPADNLDQDALRVRSAAADSAHHG